MSIRKAKQALSCTTATTASTIPLGTTLLGSASLASASASGSSTVNSIPYYQLQPSQTGTSPSQNSYYTSTGTSPLYVTNNGDLFLQTEDNNYSWLKLSNLAAELYDTIVSRIILHHDLNDLMRVRKFLDSFKQQNKQKVKISASDFYYKTAIYLSAAVDLKLDDIRKWPALNPEVVVLFNKFTESELEEILNQYQNRDSLKLACLLLPISENFAEKLINSTKKKFIKKVFINAYLASNFVSDEFIEKYKKEISLLALEYKSRKSLTETIKNIIIRDSNNLSINSVKNLKIDKDFAQEIIEKNLYTKHFVYSLIRAEKDFRFSKEFYERNPDFLEEFLKDAMTFGNYHRKSSVGYANPYNSTDISGITNSLSYVIPTIQSSLTTATIFTGDIYKDSINNYIEEQLTFPLSRTPLYYFFDSDTLEIISNTILKRVENSGDITDYLIVGSSNLDSICQLIYDFLFEMGDDINFISPEYFIQNFKIFVREYSTMLTSATATNGIQAKQSVFSVSYLKSFINLDSESYNEVKLYYELMKEELNIQEQKLVWNFS